MHPFVLKVEKHIIAESLIEAITTPTADAYVAAF